MSQPTKEETTKAGSKLQDYFCAKSDARQLLICAAASTVVELALLLFLYDQLTSIAKTNHWLEATQMPGARIADLLINRWVTTIWRGFAITAGIQIIVFTSIAFTFSKSYSCFVSRRGKKIEHTSSETGSRDSDSKAKNGI